MFALKNKNEFFSFVFVVLTIIILTILTAGVVYFPVYLVIPLTIILPIIILFFSRPEIFVMLKSSTLLLPRPLLLFTIFGIMPPEWLLVCMIWLLRVNILEAVMKDFLAKKFFNVIAGIALIVTSFSISLEWREFYYLMTTPCIIYWIIAYTIWNYNFILKNYSKATSLLTFSTLFSPLLFILILLDPGFWLIARAYSLIFGICIYELLKKQNRLNYFHSDTYNKIAQCLESRISQIISAVIVFVLCVVFYL